jgi:hypothetical protein
MEEIKGRMDETGPPPHLTLSPTQARSRAAQFLLDLHIVLLATTKETTGTSLHSLDRTSDRHFACVSRG